jgi:hypothetical protein
MDTKGGANGREYEGPTPVERCLACEADSGRHRGAVTFRQPPPIKVVAGKADPIARLLLWALDVAHTQNAGGGDPSRSRKRGNAPRVSQPLVFASIRPPFVSIRGSSLRLRVFA